LLEVTKGTDELDNTVDKNFDAYRELLKGVILEGVLLDGFCDRRQKLNFLGNKVGESSQAECLQRGIDNRHNGFEKLKRIAAVLPHIVGGIPRGVVEISDRGLWGSVRVQVEVTEGIQDGISGLFGCNIGRLLFRSRRIIRGTKVGWFLFNLLPSL